MSEPDLTTTDTRMAPVPTEDILKNLMLGLIYPAVLGSIIYKFLDVLIKQGAALPDDNILSLKFSLMVITLLFYFADYLYITFTKEFGWFFFLCDWAFVIILFLTIYLINVDTPAQPPNLGGIAWCYLGFMVLYFIWDGLEYLRCRTGTANCSKEEKTLYFYILIWEGFAIAALTLYLFCTYIGWEWTNWTFILILSVITLIFWIVTVLKAKHYPWKVAWKY